MTSSTEDTAKCRLEGEGEEEEEEGEEGEGGEGPPQPLPPLPRFPPPAPATGKPLTPFSIADILGKPRCLERAAAGRVATPSPRGPPAPASPLCALEQLASKTFRGLEGSPLLQAAANGRDPLSALLPRAGSAGSKKRRKSRTAFTNHQIFELEKRFVFQKYLSPADRDHLAAQLGLSNAQVITWFQNRRAKLKRDLEEMKADVESLKKLPPGALQRLARLPDQPPDPAPPAPAPQDPRPDLEPRPREALSDGEDEDEDDEDEEDEVEDHDDEEEEIDVGD